MELLHLVGREAMVKFLDEWQELATRTGAPNLFYEPWMLQPAVELGLCDDDPEWLLGREAGRLVAVVPLGRRNLPSRLSPAQRLRPLLHAYCCSSLPLVEAGREAEVAQRLASWLASQQRVLFVEWHRLPKDSAFYPAICAATRVAEDGGYDRACYRPTPNEAFERYLDRVLAKKHQQNYRRLEKILAREGELACEAVMDPGRGDSLLFEFLQLERAGWKGREGSALDCRDETRAFFLRTMRQGLQRGRVQILALRHRGQAIAMKTNLLDGAQSYTWKVAFDESYRKFSPGALLELASMQQLAAVPGVETMDSAGVANNEPFDRLYNERRPIAQLLLGTGSLLSRGVVAGRPALASARQQLRELRDRLRPR